MTELRAMMAAAAMLAALSPGAVNAEDVRFDIKSISIEGNTLLPAERLAELTSRFTGNGKVYGDVRKAMEALEAAYRGDGYGAATVYAPEQELTSGVVRLRVSEGRVGEIKTSGSVFPPASTLTASLPSLRKGEPLNTRRLAENLRLANENPARKTSVTLKAGAAEGTTDAVVVVTEEKPWAVTLTADDTGGETSGKHRVGGTLRYTNLFGMDETLTAGYVSAPDAPAGVNVGIYSAGARIPLYGLGDSVDLVYGSSTVNTPASVIAPGGNLSITGKGSVFSARYNMNLPRRGEFTSRLVFGADVKKVRSSCEMAGVPAPPTAGCVDYNALPLSAGWAGSVEEAGQTADLSLTVSRNTGGGGDSWRYSYAAGGRATGTDMTAARMSAGWTRALDGDFKIRAGLTAQYAGGRPLPAGEQLGLAGASAVRGFQERAFAADEGFVLQTEVWGPEMAGTLGLGDGGALRALLFYDLARGFNAGGYGTVADPWGGLITDTGTVPSNQGLSSAGLGFRLGVGKSLSMRTDFAKALNAPTVNGQQSPSLGWRAHFNMAVTF